MKNKNMKSKSQKNKIKLFGITNQILELELDRIESKYDIEFGRSKDKKKSDNTYYPQFDLKIRKEAKKMAKNYEIFYCLEKSIRDLINSILVEAINDDWWNEDGVVPEAIKTEVQKRIQNEIDSGVTIRSNNSIDFTTFGELNEIIKINWSRFSNIFSSQKAVQGVMSKLNTLRGPIAHCTELAEDEELRLQLSVRDWYRLME